MSAPAASARADTDQDYAVPVDLLKLDEYPQAPEIKLRGAFQCR